MLLGKYFEMFLHSKFGLATKLSCEMVFPSNSRFLLVRTGIASLVNKIREIFINLAAVIARTAGNLYSTSYQIFLREQAIKRRMD